MMRDKAKEQEELVRSLQEYKGRCEELDRQLKEAEHIGATATHQLQVSEMINV